MRRKRRESVRQRLDLALKRVRGGRAFWRGCLVRAKVTRGGMVKLGKGKGAIKVHPKQLPVMKMA